MVKKSRAANARYFMEHVTSELFVGRQRELEQFESLLTPAAGMTVLSVHTQGDGGIGKTQLLRRMQQICAARPEEVAFTRELIDFYHTESRSRMGVMSQIAVNLGLRHFPDFAGCVRQYQDTADASKREELLAQVQEVFRRNYQAFSEKMARSGKVIALFFDTYEVIQNVDPLSRDAEIEVTRFSHWLESHLFPCLSDNTRLIISGRYPVQELDCARFRVIELNLAHFSLADTVAFWKHCFAVETDAALNERIGSPELLRAFHLLADGRPVLLALFADWMNYARRPLSPQELVDEITRRTGAIGATVTPRQKDLFERVLIERVTALNSSEDHAITYLAFAYRRMTPEIFHAISDLPLDECRRVLLDELKPLSFIKYKSGECVLLHDEMRRLVVKHWWDAHDDAREMRRDLARQLVAYYERNLREKFQHSNVAYQTYMSELLEYAFIAEPLNGLKRFQDEFDAAMEDGKYDYADLLLREAQRYHHEHPKDLPFPESFRIELRHVRYYALTDRDYERAWQMAKDVLERYRDHPAWQEHDLLGHFWLARGQAESSLELFDEAVYSFQEAKKVFYDLGEDFWLYRTNHLIGYTYYLQARFKEAEQYLSQSFNGFSKLLLEQQEISSRKYRQMLQGLQLSLGDLAEIFGYTGQFEKAIRVAEIVLDIARNLPSNTLEVARARTIVGHQHALAGHAIDARHNLVEGEHLLRGIRNRPIIGRNRTDMGVLLYRVDEFSYLLEYYRAEEIEEMLAGFAQRDQIEQAERLLLEAIRILSEKPVIEKELADAYYALGELYIVKPSPDHWQQAEDAFLTSLKLGKISRFAYGVIDTLESLVALYYFWNGASGVSEELRAANQQKMRARREEMAQYDEQQYPNLFGKYEMTLGDIEFDHGLDWLKSADKQDTFNQALKAFHAAFTHYVTAAGLMKRFNEDRYYLTLRVCYNRLSLLLNLLAADPLSDRADWIGFLSMLWQGKVPELDQIYHDLQLRIRPQEKREEIQALAQSLTPCLERGQYGLAALRNSCLISAHAALIADDAARRLEYQQQRVEELRAQSAFYRTLGDEYQAKQNLWECRKEIERMDDPLLQAALEGAADCSEGTLLYRRGEYGRLLEFYLQDELGLARDRFDQRYPGARERAFALLKEGEEKLSSAVAQWEAESAASPSARDRLRQYRRLLGEVKFRIGELLMLNEEFDDLPGHSGAFSHLQAAIDLTAPDGDSYRHDNAVQSYINALYFAGKYDHPDTLRQRKAYQQQLEAKLNSPGAQAHLAIMCRLRIVQGDAIFSARFERQQKSEQDYTYLPRGDRPPSIRLLRAMLRYYVEACNFMAQHSAKNFAAAARVIQRRIKLIADKESLRIIQRGFVDVWTDQPFLKERGDEMETLIQFANLRSIMLSRSNADAETR